MATVATEKTLKVRHFPLDENPPKNYINNTKGIMSWLTTVDHKRIGLMYLGSVIFFFFIGGLLAILLRLELLTPAKTFIEADTYNKIFTLHGAIMVFLFIVPS